MFLLFLSLFDPKMNILLPLTSLSGLLKVKLPGVLWASWSAVGGCFWQPFVSNRKASFFDPWALSLETMAVNTGLQTICHSVEYFIFLCTYQGVKQVKFIWFEGSSYFECCVMSFKGNWSDQMAVENVSEPWLSSPSDWESFGRNTVLRLNSM